MGAEEAVDWEQVAKAGFVAVSIQGSDGDGCTFPRTADTVTVDYLEKPRAGATGLQKRRTAEFVVGSGSECKGLEEGVRQMSSGEKATIYAVADCSYDKATDVVMDVQLVSVAKAPGLAETASLPEPQREEVRGWSRVCLIRTLLH